MNEPRQAYMKLLGESGCYFLCLVHLAELVTHERIDAIPVLLAAEEKGIVNKDYLVFDAAQVMGLLTGVVWEKRYEEAGYRAGPGELEVLRYERNTGEGNRAHFVVGDGHGKIEYDPLGFSRTVKEGRLASKRIFRRL